MKALRIAATCFGLLLLPLLFLPGQEPAKDKCKKSDASQPAGKVEAKAGEEDKNKRDPIEASKVSLALLEREAAKGRSSAKENGVELAVKVKTVPNKESTDIELAWTLKYSGPRPPLIILQPSMTLTSTSTRLIFYAVPKGKDYALPLSIFGASELPGEDGLDYILDAWGDKTPLPELPRTLDPFPRPDRGFRTRTKDWFITVPAGKSAEGVITVSGAKLKDRLLTYPTYREHFGEKDPPRLFVDLFFNPWDRGEPFAFDAWVGKLTIYINPVPALKKW